MFLIPIIFSTFLNAKTFEVIKNDYDVKEEPVIKVIMEELAQFGEIKTKEVVIEKPVVKELTAGEKKIEEMKAKTRAEIQKRNEKEKSENSNNKGSWIDQMRSKVAQTQTRWSDETKEIWNQWKADQDKFLNKVDTYKENTFKLPVPEKKIIETKVTIKIPPYFAINKLFSVPVRDQEQRATCAAFAGIKSVEILLAQNNALDDLSEQYFYWASKPDCRESACAKRGSWVTVGFDYSKNQMTVDIPKEDQCKYINAPAPNNETQIPLDNFCKSGVVQVQNYKNILAINDILASIKNHEPVIMGFKLTPNFYFNKGLITYEDSIKETNQKMDSHSAGHAVVGVGVIDLPEKLKEKEGDFCVLIVNSWGKGWGAGGYACITQKWFNEYRFKANFVALTKIKTKD